LRHNYFSGVRIPCILIAVFVLLGFFSYLKKSATYDEVQHFPCGAAYWKLKTFCFGLEHPPFLRLWAALPAVWTKVTLPEQTGLERCDRTSLAAWDFKIDYEFGYKFLYEEKNAGLLNYGRFLILLLAVPLGWVIYKWACSLYGEKKALLSLSLFAFCPNLLAHARLVTTDFGGTVFIFLGAFFLLRFFKNPSRRTALFSGVSWGLALSGKFNAVFLGLFFAAAGIIFYGRKKHVPGLLLQAVLVWLVINLSYFFSEPVLKHWFLKKELEIFFPQQVSQTLRNILYWVPLPDMWLRGFMYAFLHGQSAVTSYFLGKISQGGTWYYYPALFFLKTPLVTQLFLLLAVLSVSKKKVSREEWYYLIPPLIYSVFLLKAKINLGIRHFLPVYPFLYLFAGRLEWKKAFPYLLALLFISNLRSFPHYLAYMNIFVSRDNAWKYVDDSNLDWGQDLGLAAEFLKKEGNPPVYLTYFGTASPDYYDLRYEDFYSVSIVKHLWHPQPLDGPPRYWIVSCTNLSGRYYGRSLFGELEKLTPVKTAGHSVKIYDLKGGDIRLAPR